MVLEYDGTRYRGFQWQANAPTIQGEVEKAIKLFTGETIRIRAASRTDAGVHARGQVLDFVTCARYTTETFIKAMNWYLPPDIRVREAWRAHMEFNSRRDAVTRIYRYTLSNTRSPPALLRSFSHWVSTSLDVAVMGRAAGHLLGIHDFSALAGPLPPERSSVRRVERWDVWREGELVLIEAEANGFLPHQIRRTNGILVDIGRGRLRADVLKELMDGKINGMKHCPLLLAKGLCLAKVHYPEIST